MKSRLLVIATFMLSMVWAHAVKAEELVVIVNPDMQGSMSHTDVARIFLGKSTQFPSGELAEPLDVDPSHPNYHVFAREVLNKSPSQLRAYWAKQIFTGRGLPPKSAKDEEELRTLVAENKRYLSYIDSAKKDDSVRAVLKIVD